MDGQADDEPQWYKLKEKGKKAASDVGEIKVGPPRHGFTALLGNSRSGWV